MPIWSIALYLSNAVINFVFDNVVLHMGLFKHYTITRKIPHAYNIPTHTEIICMYTQNRQPGRRTASPRQLQVMNTPGGSDGAWAVDKVFHRQYGVFQCGHKRCDKAVVEATRPTSRRYLSPSTRIAMFENLLMAHLQIAA